MSDNIVVVGGGHNGLVAAAYLAQAGKNVTVLERLDHLGGAAVSSYTFEGVDARLSRYSYLVSLLPERIIRELGLRLRLKRRRYSSYTPEPGTDRGLLVDNQDARSTAASFASIGAAGDAAAWHSFYAATARMARALFPTVCDPLLTRSEARGALGDDKLWSAIVEQPIGEAIESAFTSDVVRGVAMTDGLIGTFARARDASLAANRCFLYHVIGGETGDWDLPVGGMGAVTDELAKAAKNAGATILTGAEVTSITPDGEVRYRRRNSERELRGETVLANVAPYVLEQLVQAGLRRGGPAGPPHPEPPRPEGAQVKVNLMLSRLPRLRDRSVDPAAAFGGTFHINECYSQLDAAYDAASSGSIPEPLPCEIYCHTLADPSILSDELAASGAHTLTVFALHTPDRLLAGEGQKPDQDRTEDHDAMRQRLQAAVLDSLDSVLAEPIADVLLPDAQGRPCIETKTTLDIEEALRMPGGNIFHGPLSWPFVEDDADLSTPAQRWGVDSGYDRILLCGSGARRGGAVSGIGGHNAAMAVLER
ncbi:NAD(P)/FAD-dependent oxidoreductase [Parafrigoribacterium mesophilum]|uniref:phytoene desaturase family protein n=1 Tax=Parafrigoribacterium mesophilum TaxID=433646 RepID=UPI0031FDBCC6